MIIFKLRGGIINSILGRGGVFYFLLGVGEYDDYEDLSGEI